MTATGVVVIGYQALEDGTNSLGSTAIGYQAMKEITSGDHNTAIGYQAMYQSLTNADNNVFVGYQAGGGAWSTSASSGCTGVGKGAMAAAMNGANNNTAVGMLAGSAITTGIDNVLIGVQAGDSCADANGNVILGSGSDTASDANYTNILGQNITSGATQRTLVGAGGTYATLDHSNSSNSWGATSDIRIKKDINDIDLGLDFINKIRPVKYKERPKKDWPEEFLSKNGNEDLEIESGKEFVGFISQEVKEIMDKDNTTFSGWQVDENTGRQELQYERFVAPLVKAVQELSAKNEALEKRIEELEG